MNSLLFTTDAPECACILQVIVRLLLERKHLNVEAEPRCERENVLQSLSWQGRLVCEQKWCVGRRKRLWRVRAVVLSREAWLVVDGTVELLKSEQRTGLWRIKLFLNFLTIWMGLLNNEGMNLKILYANLQVPTIRELEQRQLLSPASS